MDHTCESLANSLCGSRDPELSCVSLCVSRDPELSYVKLYNGQISTYLWKYTLHNEEDTFRDESILESSKHSSLGESSVDFNGWTNMGEADE